MDKSIARLLPGSLRGRLFCATVALLIVSTFGAVKTAQAQTVFSQDFSSGSTLSTYVGSADNKFDAIATSGSAFTWTINNGSLQGARTTGNGGAFSRTTDLATSFGAIYKFSINVTASTAAVTTAMTFQVGSLTTGTTADLNISTHSRFGINLTATGTYSFRDIGTNTNSATFSGAQNVFFVVNNCGSLLTYTAPDGTSQTVGDDKWDLWIGKSQVFDEIAATTGTIAPTDFKLSWTGGVCTSLFDNFEVIAVPEPATVLGGMLLVGTLGWNQCRRVRRWFAGRRSKGAA